MTTDEINKLFEELMKRLDEPERYWKFINGIGENDSASHRKALEIKQELKGSGTKTIPHQALACWGSLQRIGLRTGWLP